jgi:outer membrane protein TolC
MKKIITLLLCFMLVVICGNKSNAQKILSINDFIQKVKAHHPQIKIAKIAIQKADANLLIAKGAFDPSIQLEARQKTFDGKNYYTYNNAVAKMPLPIGEVKTGMEKNNGQFLESEITSGKSSYAGIEIPLAKGLLIDKRRAQLQQAKIGITQSEFQQKIIENELLFDAYQAYFQWAANYNLYQVYNSFLKINTERINLIKTLQKNGDRAAMDTTEAIAQLQNIVLQQTDAKVKLMSSKIMIDNFIWDSIGNPQFIADDVLPDSALAVQNNLNLISLLQSVGLQSPVLNFYRLKLNVLEVDRKLKYQNLLPTVNLKANILSKNYYAFKNTGAAYLDNNNYWGIDIKFPLRMREARGELRSAKLKLEETNWELKQKTLEIENKLKDYYNQYFLLSNQIDVANATLNNYKSLLKNETLRFTNGESSLFLVNTRENKVLETQQKIIELQLKLIKAKFNIDWAAGVIN